MPPEGQPLPVDPSWTSRAPTISLRFLLFLGSSTDAYPCTKLPKAYVVETDSFPLCASITVENSVKILIESGSGCSGMQNMGYGG